MLCFKAIEVGRSKVECSGEEFRVQNVSDSKIQRRGSWETGQRMACRSPAGAVFEEERGKLSEEETSFSGIQ